MRKMNKEVFLLVLGAVVAFLPALQPGIIPWNDAAYHLSRIDSLYEALLAGIFPVKVHPVFAGYGYGSGLFYPNTLLYIPALLMMGGVSLEWAYKVFFLLILISLALVMYESCLKMTQNASASFFAAFFYLYANRTFYNVYDRFALGEITASIFLPLVVCGVYLFFVREGNPLRMILGVIGLIHTHVITTVLTALACFLLLIISTGRIQTKKRKLAGFVIAMGCALLTCASYWVPMWQQYRAMRIHAQAPWAVSSDYVIPLSTAAGAEGYGLPVIFLAGAAVALLFYQMHVVRDVTAHTDGGSFLSIGIILTFLTYIRPFFALMNRMGIRLIQFPTRIYSVAIVFLLVGSAMVLSDERWNTGVLQETFSKTAVRAGVLLSLVLYSLVMFRGNLKAGPEILMQVSQRGTDTMGAWEWLPLQTTTEMLKTPSTAYDAAGNAIAGEKENHESIFRFSTKGKSPYYIVPFIYYRGYEAWASDGSAVETDIDPGTGLLRLSHDAAADGQSVEITVFYTGTCEMKLSYAISIFGIICVIMFCRYWSRIGNGQG